MKPILKTKRTNQPRFDKPHITIDNRGLIFFNRAYMDYKQGFTFEVYENENVISFVHGEGNYVIKYNNYAYFCQNKPLADYLIEKLGTSFFVDKSLFGFSALIAQKQELKSIKINGTVYSITGAKNLINTLRIRSQKSATNKSRQLNLEKYKQTLALAKKFFPNEFINY